MVPAKEKKAARAVRESLMRGSLAWLPVGRARRLAMHFGEPLRAIRETIREPLHPARYLGFVPDFKLNSAYTPTADQPKAIAGLAECLDKGERFQTLLGATG